MSGFPFSLLYVRFLQTMFLEKRVLLKKKMFKKKENVQLTPSSSRQRGTLRLREVRRCPKVTRRANASVQAEPRPGVSPAGVACQGPVQARGDKALGCAHRSGASESSTLGVVLLESWVSVPDIFFFLPSAPG